VVDGLIEMDGEKLLVSEEETDLLDVGVIEMDFETDSDAAGLVDIHGLKNISGKFEREGSCVWTGEGITLT